MSEPADKDKPDKDHPHGGPPGQTGEHPHGGPPGQDKPDKPPVPGEPEEPEPAHPIVIPPEEETP